MKKNLITKFVILALLVLTISGCSQETPVDNAVENDEEITLVDNTEGSSTEELPAIEDEESLSETRVIAEILNIRSDSSPDGDVIGQLKSGQVVKPLAIEVTDQGNYWYQIEVGDDKGWIAGWYTIDNEAYESQSLKSHLLPAFEGKLPTVKGTLQMTYDEVISAYDGSLESMYFLGGEALFNELATFQFAEKDMVFINIRPEEKVYGIEPNSTLQLVKTTLGKPDLEMTIDDPEGLGIFEDGGTLVTYLTGSYRVDFSFNDGVNLNNIQLSPYRIQNRSTESSQSKGSSFDQVYESDGLYDAMLAFNNNPSETYAKKAVEVFEAEVTKMNLDFGNFVFPIPQGYLGTYSYKDIGFLYPSIDTEKNQINISGMDSSVKGILTTVEEHEIFRPAVISYATEGNVQISGLSFTLDEELIKTVLGMYAQIGKSLDDVSLELQPFYLPSEIFNGEAEFVQSYSVTYPKVYVRNFNDLKKFDGADTWKMEIIYPLKVVDTFIPEVDEETSQEGVDGSDDSSNGLTSFSNELINGQQLSYDQLTMAVIEGYAGKNSSLLDEKYVINDAYPEGDWLEYTIGVMGRITNVKLFTQKSMSEEFVIKNIGPEISNTLLKIRSAFPTDFSFDRLEFYDVNGEKHSIVIETMSDNISIVTTDLDMKSNPVETTGSLKTTIIEDPNKKSVDDNGFISETISTVKIDYAENIITLFPWHYAGVNSDLMSNQSIKLQQGSDQVSLSVIGKLENVEVIQRHSGSSDIINPIQPTTFENTVVNFSYKYNGMFGDTVMIIVKGDVVYDNGHVESIEIPLITSEQPAKGSYIKQLPKVLPF